MNEQSTYTRHEVNVLKFYVQHAVSRSALATVKTDVDVCEMIAGDIVATLTAFIAGKTCTLVDETWPADWWAAVRERFFPRWYLRRRPSRMIRFHVDKHTLLPDIVIPPHAPRIVLECVRRPSSVRFGAP